MIDHETKITALIASKCRRKIGHLWGQAYRIHPRFVPTVFGDGMKIVWFEPMDTRPDYYILRVDSSWDTDNSGKNPLCEHLEEICYAIENAFGCAREEYEHDNGRTYVKHHPFPALSMDSTGCACWGEFEIDWK